MKEVWDKLSEEDMKGNLFRIAKQLVRNNKDVVGSGSVKDRYCC